MNLYFPLKALESDSSENVMAESQKLSSYSLDDLPDEVLLKVLGFLGINELLLCGQVSTQLRAISNDASLWLKLNMYRRQQVPYKFIEKAVENGCQYLSVAGSGIPYFIGKSKSPFNLKYLNLSQKMSNTPNCQELPKIIQNCSSLQKLSVAALPLDSDAIQYICQNGQSLQVLDMAGCNIIPWNLTSLQNLFINCTHLTELNICGHNTINTLLVPHIQALVDNLTPTILKLGLAHQTNLEDESVKKLVERCHKITDLDLSWTEITNDSVQSIIKHLNTSLEKLDLSGTTADFSALLELKSMPILKKLICFDDYFDDSESIWSLQQQLTHISVTDTEFLHIASPFKNNSCIFEESIDEGWIWEVRAKQQNHILKIQCVKELSFVFEGCSKMK